MAATDSKPVFRQRHLPRSSRRVAFRWKVCKVAYVELSKCTSKEQEVLAPSAKEDRMLTVDSAGSAKLKGPQAKVEADLTSDLLICYALTRRGLAGEQAVERLMKSKPKRPVGYARISHKQVKADRRLWQLSQLDQASKRPRLVIRWTQSGTRLVPTTRAPCCSLCQRLHRQQLACSVMPLRPGHT